MKNFYTKTAIMFATAVAMAAYCPSQANAESKRVAFAANAAEAQIQPALSTNALGHSQYTGMKVDKKLQISDAPLLKDGKSLKMRKAPSSAKAPLFKASDVAGSYLAMSYDEGVSVVGPEGCFFEEGDTDTELYLCDFLYGYASEQVNDLDCTLEYTDFGTSMENILYVNEGFFFSYPGYKFTLTFGAYVTDKETGKSGLSLISDAIPFLVEEDGLISMLSYDLSEYFSEAIYGALIYDPDSGIVYDFLPNIVFQTPNGVQSGLRTEVDANENIILVQAENPVCAGFQAEYKKFVIYNFGGYGTPLYLDFNFEEKTLTAEDALGAYVAVGYNEDMTGYEYEPFYWMMVEYVPENDDDWDNLQKYTINATYKLNEDNNTVITFQPYVLMNKELGWYDWFEEQTIILDGDLFGVSGINSVENDSANGPVEYYNMQGMKVQNPKAGQLYIKKQGSKAVKVIR